MKLHLGNEDIPYADSEDGLATTGDVATFLENKYQVKQTFADKHLDDIANDLAEGLAGSLESLIMGAPPTGNPYQESTEAIDQRFVDFLSMGEMEKMGIPGVPTKASINRRSLRFKSKKNPNPRPSFIDTGQYEATSISWVEE